MQVKVKCEKERFPYLSVWIMSKENKTKTEEQAAFIVENRKEMRPCQAPKDRARRLKRCGGAADGEYCRSLYANDQWLCHSRNFIQ